MKIDYVILSSDENELYSDFYPVVSRQWKHFGLNVMYIKITDEDTLLRNTDTGCEINIKAVKDIDTGFQSQIVRLYASQILNNKNILISDIDMLPLSSKYYVENAKKVENNKILIYSGQPYTDVPHYPACYILGNSDILREVWDIEESYEDFVRKMYAFSNGDWNTDEKYMYTKLSEFENKIVLRDRKFSHCSSRFDRVNNDTWRDTLDVEKLLKGGYIDSHLIRPYSKHKESIDRLLFYEK
tara:strand:+ start:1195 stop:1920 length:726 start_codon:yes stop_codon:yes gene_type:complete